MLTQSTIRDAEDAIQVRLKAEDFVGVLVYDSKKVIEGETWWYIPFYWIGCAGFIVNKTDLYVNWLGSSLSLEQCIWGHERCIFCDLVDFTFASDTKTELATRLLSHFKHTLPNKLGTKPVDPVWYRDSEIPTSLRSNFPVFRRHFAWSAIPALLDAYENEGLKFSCELSKPAHPCRPRLVLKKIKDP